MKQKTVLITCIGGFYALDTIQALRQSEPPGLRVIGVDTRQDVVARHYVDHFETIRPASEDPHEFIVGMRDLCEREAVDLVIPGSDEEAEALSQQHGSFGSTRLAVDQPDRLRILRDKLELFRRLEEGGVKVPYSAAIDDLADLRKFVDSLPQGSDGLYVLKPRTGRGSRGIYIIMPDSTDAISGRRLDGVRHSVLSRLDMEGEFTAQGLVSQMGMEFLPGDVFDVDCIARDGEPLCLVTRRRLHDGPFSRGVEGHRIEHNEAILEHAKAVCSTLGLDGIFDLDYGIDSEGSPGLLEVNPRWSGSVATSVASGVNVPVLAVTAMLGGDVPPWVSGKVVDVVPVTRMLHRWPVSGERNDIHHI